MICGKSPPSEYILEKIKSNNSLVFKEDFERKIFHFCQNIFFFTHIKKDRTNIEQTKSLFPIRLNFAIFTHQVNLSEKFCNKMYRSFEPIYNIIFSFYNYHKS